MHYGDKMHPYSLHNDIMGAAIKLMKSINLKCLQLQKSSEVKGKSDETSFYRAKILYRLYFNQLPVLSNKQKCRNTMQFRRVL